MGHRRGVYFLANDHVLDQAIAFLNSFRRYNPAIPLCLIPFAADIDRLAALRDRYGFTVWRDDALLARCDSLSRLFHDRTLGHYRKFATWMGDFEEFLYIDCDTVVLEAVDEIFDFLDRFDVVTGYSNGPESRRWVWKDSIDDAGVLDERQTAYAAGTGVVLSRRGFLPLDDVLRRAPAALALASHMELACYEQPVLNFMIVTSGGRYTSLHAIAAAAGWPDIPMERWVGDDDLRFHEGRVRQPVAPRTLLVHWAGEWDRARRTGTPVRHRELWEFYRER